METDGSCRESIPLPSAECASPREVLTFKEVAERDTRRVNTQQRRRSEKTRVQRGKVEDKREKTRETFGEVEYTKEWAIVFGIILISVSERRPLIVTEESFVIYWQSWTR